MDCPRCATVALTERERTGVTIDFCTNCRGVWLDSGELENLISSEQRYYDDRRGNRDDDRRGNRNDDDDEGGGGFLQNIMDLFGGD
jgi:Zn-finger nucleic acid-binding protein